MHFNPLFTNTLMTSSSSSAAKSTECEWEHEAVTLYVAVDQLCRFIVIISSCHIFVITFVKICLDVSLNVVLSVSVDVCVCIRAAAAIVIIIGMKLTVIQLYRSVVTS